MPNIRWMASVLLLSGGVTLPGRPSAAMARTTSSRLNCCALHSRKKAGLLGGLGGMVRSLAQRKSNSWYRFRFACSPKGLSVIGFYSGGFKIQTIAK